MTRAIYILLGFGTCFFLAIILFPIFGRPRDPNKRGSCQSNLKQIGLGLLQYTQDYDERLPLASTPQGGWASGLYPYLKSTQLFQCPTEETPSAPQPSRFNFKADGATDYYLNAQIQGRPMADLGDISHLVLIGEGNNGKETTDGSYSKFQLPDAWREDETSPAYRHLGRANYTFVDGHVKAVKVEDISANAASGKFYFEPDITPAKIQ